MIQTILLIMVVFLWVFTGICFYLDLESRWFNWHLKNNGVKSALRHEHTIATTAILIMVTGLFGPLVWFVHQQFKPKL